MRQNFFIQKNIKLVELSRFAHPYNNAHPKNKKYAHYLSCIGFRLTEHFIYFFHFWRRKKIPEFFTAIFRTKLHVIINNY